MAFEQEKALFEIRLRGGERKYSMLTVRSGETKPGMIAAQDILDSNGRLIVPQGTKLTEKHIQALKMWGIPSIQVETGEAAPGPATRPAAPAVSIAAAIRTKQLFKFNADKVSNPFVASLTRLTYARLSDKFGPGDGKPAARASIDVPPRPAPSRVEPTPDGLVHRADLASAHPAVYMHLMEVVNHPYSSAEDIARVIGEDPGLTARLLRIANSSFYAFPGRIDSVSRAVTVIGTTQLCDLALATSATKLFHQIPPELIDQRSFWEHSVSTGVFARQLAACRRLPNVERIFTAGLLHDIGRAVLFICLPDLSAYLIAKTRAEQELMVELERQELGFTHADLAEALLEEWNIPESIREPAGCHHTPAGASKFPVETAIIHLADMFSTAMELGTSGEVCVPPISARAWERLDVSDTVLPALVEDSKHQIADMLAILSDEN